MPSAPRSALRLTLAHLLTLVAAEEDSVDEGEAVHQARMAAYGDDDGQGEHSSRMRRVLTGVGGTLRTCRLAALHPLVNSTHLAVVIHLVAAMQPAITEGHWHLLSPFADMPVPDQHNVERFGCMYGLDGMDLQLDTSQQTERPEALRAGSTLVRSRGTGMLSDYDPRTLVGSHPTAFPYGTGGCPKGMSAAEHAKLLLARAPRRKHAGDTELVLHLFNTVQRMRVNQQAYVQTHVFKGGDWNTVNSIPSEQAAAIGDLMSLAPGTKHAKELYAALTPAQRLLLNSARTTASRLPGSKGSMGSLRSKASGSCCLHGMWSMMLNLNPSELDCPVVFRERSGQGSARVKDHSSLRSARSRPRSRSSLTRLSWLPKRPRRVTMCCSA